MDRPSTPGLTERHTKLPCPRSYAVFLHTLQLSTVSTSASGRCELLYMNNDVTTATYCRALSILGRLALDHFVCFLLCWTNQAPSAVHATNRFGVSGNIFLVFLSDLVVFPRSWTIQPHLAIFAINWVFLGNHCYPRETVEILYLYCIRELHWHAGLNLRCRHFGCRLCV